MKKSIILFLFFLNSILTSGQNVLYQQDFENGLGNISIFDIDGNTPINIDTIFGEWTIYNDPFDGNVISVSGFGAGNSSNDWMILPEINVVNSNTLLSWKARNVIESWFPMGFSVLISTNGGDDVANFTDEIFNISAFDLQNTWNTFHLDLGGYIGENVSIAFKSNGGGYLLELDDLKIYERLNEELNFIEVNAEVSMNTAFNGVRDISFEIMNTGTSVVNSFDAELVLNGVPIAEENYSSLNISSFESQTFSIESISFNLGDDQELLWRVKNINNSGIIADEMQINFDCWGEVPEDAFESILTDVTMQQHSLIEALGQGPIVLDFYAHWCGPCIQEIPELIELTEQTNTTVFSIIISNQSTVAFDFLLFRLYNHYQDNIFASSPAVPYHVVVCPDDSNYSIIEKKGYTNFETWTNVLLDCNSFILTDINEISESTNDEIMVLPNPTNNNVTFNFGDTPIGNVSISIFDSQGTLVFQKEKHDTKNILEVSFIDNPSGMYFTQILKKDGASIFKKIIVNR
jgi:hypothetical protein